MDETRSIWTGRVGHYAVTLLTGISTAFAVWWWAYYFHPIYRPQYDDRGDGFFGLFCPALFVALLVTLIAWGFHRKAQSKQSRVLLAMNCAYLVTYIPFLVRVVLYFTTGVVVPTSLVLVAMGLPVLVYVVLKRLGQRDDG